MDEHHESGGTPPSGDADPASTFTPGTYGSALAEYLRTRSESALYQASLLGGKFVQQGIGPEEIIALHAESLDAALSGLSPREQVHASTDGLQFLLEIMIAYGVQFQEHLEQRVHERTRDAEALAALERDRAALAEQAERERADMLSIVAHELRTPLTAAKGHVDMALRSLARGLTDRVQPHLGTTKEALDRLSRLTSDLVESSRGELLRLQHAPQDLAVIAKQACTWARSTAVEKGIDLQCESAGQPISLVGDADALLSACGNLLSNAIRYTPAGGQVKLRSGGDDEWAWVEVEDTGIGMSPEVQSHIFEKFYRAPEARAIETYGLGLGLSLVYRLVSAHGGRVEVHSAPGAGSTFRIVLPRTPTLAHGAASSLATKRDTRTTPVASGQAG